MNKFDEIEGIILDYMNQINEPLGIILIVLLAIAGVVFTLTTRFVQFRYIKEMIRLLFSNDRHEKGKHISSFQAFAISIASRVGTGNLAGVATAIAIGGPGAIFWMWVMALIGSANAFVESTLAQLFKVKSTDSYVGGPAYYIQKGLHKRWLAYIFVIAIVLDFGLTNNLVQSNTISLAFSSAFGIDTMYMALILAALSLFVIFGGIQRIAKVSSVVVPVMAIFYVILSIVIILLRFDRIPDVLSLIVKNAFGLDQVVGGGIGMTILIGFKRGLFSNEAGEGSAPNAAATATTSHPVKQGLIQTLGVFTDTLLICTCTAFIILCSGLFNSGKSGIELTQIALTNEIGAMGSSIIAVMIFFFAFTSIIGNYYYGESNLYFMTKSKRVLFLYRVAVGLLVLIGAITTLELSWAMVDFCMAIMTICNLIAILLLGKYAVRCLDDYSAQKKRGMDPVYSSSVIPEIASETECWTKQVVNENE